MQEIAGLAESLTELEGFFRERGWKHCLVGGLASNRWGEVRYTQDIDVVLFSAYGDEEAYIEGLLTSFSPRAGRPDVKEFALQNRVILLESSSGVPIDVSLGALYFEESMLARAKHVEILPHCRLPVATAEDVIVMKALAGRPHDWVDIQGIIARQRGALDWDYVKQWLIPLLEELEISERAEELNNLRQRLESEPSPAIRLKKRSKKKGREERGD